MYEDKPEQDPVAEDVTCTRCGHIFTLQSIGAVCPRCAAPVELADPADVLLRGVRAGLPWLLAYGLISLALASVGIVLGTLMRLRGPGSFLVTLVVILLPLAGITVLCLIVGVVRSTPTRAMRTGRTRKWGRLVRLATLCFVGVVIGHAAAQPFAVQIYGTIVLLGCLTTLVRALTIILLAIYLDISVFRNAVSRPDLKLALIVLTAAHAVVNILSTVIEHAQYRASPELGALMSAITPYALVGSWALQLLSLLVLVAFLLRVRAVIKVAENIASA